MAGLRLRLKDIDFERLEITVREGKCGTDRRTMLPASLAGPLRHQLKRVITFHKRNVADKLAPVYLPGALQRKYPNAVRVLAW